MPAVKPVGQPNEEVMEALDKRQQRHIADQRKLSDRQRMIQAETARLKEVLKQRPLTPEERDAFNKLTQ